MPIEKPLVRNLLKLAKAYAEHSGLSLASVARYSCGNHAIFQGLEKRISGASKTSISLRTYDQIVAYIEERWSREEWPKGITKLFREASGADR